MNLYATKIEEKEEKRFFKTVRVKIAHSRMGRRGDIVTLTTPEIKKKFWKILQKNNIDVGKKHIDVGTEHIYPPPLVEDEKKRYGCPYPHRKRT